jgi:hypothetical protein
MLIGNKAGDGIAGTETLFFAKRAKGDRKGSGK